MEPQEQGQPLLRKDDFSEEVISQILKKGTNQREKERTQTAVKVVTHLIHIICEANDGATEALFGPPVKSCKVCGDAVDGHYVITKHSFFEPSTNPYMCGICGEAFAQGYLLKIHLEIEHGFVEKDSNRRSLRIRNKIHEVRPTRTSCRTSERKKDEVGLRTKTDDREEEEVASRTKGHVTGGVLDSIQDKENKSQESEQQLRTAAPDTTILLTSNGGDNFVEDNVEGVSDDEVGGKKSLGERNDYKSGDLIVINLFTEGSSLPSKRSRRAGRQKGTSAEGSKKYKCEFCEIGFNSQHKRGSHIKESHPDCRLKCDQCETEFSERRLLNMHVKIHRKVRPPPKPKEVKKRVPPVCTVCDKNFLHESGLQIHTQNFHPELVKGQKSFCCEKCGAMFWTRTAMVEHQRIHSDKKPFICSYCKKGFCRRSDLKSHVKVHTGEKPFKCSHCDRAFRQRLQMVNHVRTHTGEKPYKCEFCEKAFVKRDQYTRHRRVHTKERPYKCSQCGKDFKSKSNLNDHERVHTGVKPYKCTHCIQAFAQLTNLIHHVRIHTGQKPYVCPQCQRCFSRSNSLKTHIKSHKTSTEASKHPSGQLTTVRQLHPIQIPIQQQQLNQLPLLQDLPVQQQSTNSVIADATEMLASITGSFVANLEEVSSSVSQHMTNLIAGGPVTPVASFIPNTSINGFGAPENEANECCGTIVVLASMSDYQPMQVSQNLVNL